MPALGGASRRSRKCDVVSCCFPILMQRGYGRVGPLLPIGLLSQSLSFFLSFCARECFQ